jgi:predicted unusual protein kinase regulating ubiquinone biosynthesis (AarF/ABC1/UbiB family)
MANLKQTWTTAAFTEESEKLKRSLRGLYAPGDPEELRYLMDGYQKLEAGTQQSLLMEFIFVLNALEFHRDHGGLTESESKKLAETGVRILRAAGIDPSRSQLSFLYRRLYHLRADIVAKHGRTDEGAWLVESSEHLCYRSEAHQKKEQLLKRAKFLLRLGHATLARDLLAEIEASDHEPDQIYFRARCEWLAGNSNSAIQLCRSNHEKTAWLKSLLEAASSSEYRPFSNEIKKIVGLPTEVLFSSLWFYGPSPLITKSLALKSSSLRRRFSAAELKKDQATLLIDSLEALQEGYDNSYPLISRLNKIGDVFAERKNFKELEHEMLFLAVAARHACRYSQFSLDDLLISEYKSLSAKMMPTSIDALCILSDLTKQGYNLRHDLQTSGRPQQGQIGRTTRVAGLVAKGMTTWASAKFRGMIAGEEARRAIYEQSQQQLGEHLLNLMSDLKGGFMKIGQLIATSHEVPAELREPAKLLFNQAEPTNTVESRLLVEKELGGPISNFFSEWEDAPFAVGSVGQVFRARTIDGQEVAVKVQHPNILATLKSDCNKLKWTKPILRHFLPNADHDGLINEVIDRVLGEADYRLEAANQIKVGEYFCNEAFVVIPKVYTELSTEKVLTTAFVRGRNFSEFLEQANSEERSHAASVILRTVCTSFFKHQMFNADPHPGNYLFLPEGKIAFIDFGCFKVFPSEIVRATYSAAKSAIQGDYDKNRQAWIDLGYVRNQETFDFQGMYQLFRTIYSAASVDRDVQFDHKMLAKISSAQLASPVGRQIDPPADTAMLLRFNWGLLSVLAYLEPELNFHRLAHEGFMHVDKAG